MTSINDADNQLISASVCNECVMNVSNFFHFKKKIVHAQDYLNLCSAEAECIEEADDENMEREETEYDADDGGGGGEAREEEKSSEEADNDEKDMILYTFSEDDTMPEEHLDRSQSPVDDEVYLLPLESSEPLESTSNRPTTPDVKVMSAEKRKPLPNQNRGQTKRPKAAVLDNSEKVTIQMNECLVCPSILADIIDLNNHILTHKTIACKTCKRSFARYSNLKRHFNSAHSKPKPFQCDICGLGFSFSINLQAHAAIHYGKNIRMT